MYNFRKKGLQTGFLTVLLTLAGNAYAGAITIQASTPFAKGTHVREAVKQECQLDTKLPNFIQEFAKAYGIDVKLKSGALNTKKGKTLVLEITNVTANGGGAWSGTKSMSVAGKLYDHGKLIGDFTGSRYSGGGFFAAYKGTCSIVGRCSKTLGKDIANWLKHPTRKAHLGDG